MKKEKVPNTTRAKLLSEITETKKKTLHSIDVDKEAKNENKLKELNEKLREDISDINEENIVIESQYKKKFDDVTSFSETIEEYRSRCETRMTEIKDIQTKIESINKEVKRIKKEGRIVEDEIKRFNQLI